MKQNSAIDFFMNSLHAESYPTSFWNAYNKAKEMYEEQLKAAYTEGFKRCHFIKLLEGGYMPFPEEKMPEDFDTYFQKTYGE